MDIVVSRTGTEIDGDFHHLPPHGVPHVERAALVRGNPSYIDLSLYYPGGGQGASGVPRPPVRTALRFPFGPGAEREGERAFAHYNRDLPGKPDFFHGRGDGTDAEDLSKCYAAATKRTSSYAPVRNAARVCSRGAGRAASAQHSRCAG